MTTLTCSQCNYKFDAETLKIPKRCPYCGRAGSVKQEKTAEALVEEVSKILEEA
jgi:predicted Zn-ribbon and HTH transcriptional regulator